MMSSMVRCFALVLVSLLAAAQAFVLPGHVASASRTSTEVRRQAGRQAGQACTGKSSPCCPLQSHLHHLCSLFSGHYFQLGMAKVKFPSGRQVDANAGESLKAVAQKAGAKISYGCEEGKCGTCEHKVGGKKIRICIGKVPAGAGPFEFKQ
jgi:hypothetical protein